MLLGKPLNILAPFGRRRRRGLGQPARLLCRRGRRCWRGRRGPRDHLETGLRPGRRIFEFPPRGRIQRNLAQIIRHKLPQRLRRRPGLAPIRLGRQRQPGAQRIAGAALHRLEGAVQRRNGHARQHVPRRKLAPRLLRGPAQAGGLPVAGWSSPGDQLVVIPFQVPPTGPVRQKQARQPSSQAAPPVLRISGRMDNQSAGQHDGRRVKCVARCAERHRFFIAKRLFPAREGGLQRLILRQDLLHVRRFDARGRRDAADRARRHILARHTDQVFNQCEPPAGAMISHALHYQHIVHRRLRIAMRGGPRRIHRQHPNQLAVFRQRRQQHAKERIGLRRLEDRHGVVRHGRGAPRQVECRSILIQPLLQPQASVAFGPGSVHRSLEAVLQVFWQVHAGVVRLDIEQSGILIARGAARFNALGPKLLGRPDGEFLPAHDHLGRLIREGRPAGDNAEQARKRDDLQRETHFRTRDVPRTTTLLEMQRGADAACTCSQKLAMEAAIPHKGTMTAEPPHARVYVYRNARFCNCAVLGIALPAPRPRSDRV